MKIKDGVVMPNQLVMRKVLIAAEKIWKDFGQELVITAGMDGTHSAGSLHPYGYAIDLRTRYFEDGEVKRRIANQLRETLGHKYDVILHKTHVHVEYQEILR